MIIKTEKHRLQCLADILENFIPMLQLSNLKNAERSSKTSAEYLSARVINCVLEDLLSVLSKKKSSPAKNISLKLDDAIGIILYRTLIMMPVHEANVYLHHTRQGWIEQLDKQIIYSIPKTTNDEGY